MKLEYLIPYLPWDLKMDISHTDYAIQESKGQNRLKECKLVGINTDSEFAAVCLITNIKSQNNGILFFNINTPKPILRPLSCIKNGENGIFKRDGVKHIQKLEDVSNCSFAMSSQLLQFEYLFKNHYDVFGLIEKGLAVDINTL